MTFFILKGVGWGVGLKFLAESMVWFKCFEMNYHKLVFTT